MHSLLLALLAPSLLASPEEPDAPAPGAEPFTLPADFATRAGEYMKERARVTGFSGAALIAWSGKPVLREAYGLANHEFSVPNTPEMKFRIGSITKQFTAAAILLLEQRGQLLVSDPVSKHLSDWPATWKGVTIHHLLSHTGGLPRLTTRAMLDVSAMSRATPAVFRGVRDLMEAGEESQPLDEPDEKFAYSNIGYIALGMIIEKVSGKSFCGFLSEEILRPLGMTRTACEDPAEILSHRASGYTRVEGKPTNAGYVDVRFVSAAGALYSTIDDLLAWDRSLDSGVLLNAGARGKFFTPVKADYAYGWWIQTRFGRKVEWHGGNISGFVAHLARYPAERLCIIVLSNMWSNGDRSQVRTIVNELSAMAFGKPYELPRERKQISLDPGAIDAFVGVYTGKDAFAIAREGERVMMQFPPGQSVLEILPESPTRFFAKGREHYFTFTRDETGKVTDVLVNNEGELGRWTKSQ